MTLKLKLISYPLWRLLKLTMHLEEGLFFRPRSERVKDEFSHTK